MPASLTYRTTDLTRWGGGLGSKLSSAQVDLNFWILFDALSAIEDSQGVLTSIDYITVTGNQMFVHLTNHVVLGPFTLPTGIWHPRGNWAPVTPYAAFDVVSNNGTTYLVAIAHTSGSVFSEAATDGLGSPLYVAILRTPSNALPSSGTPGQRLVKATGSPYTSEWLSDFVRLCLYIEGQPTASEFVLQYIVTDDITFPGGLIGSGFHASTVPTANAVFQINKNGAAIGQISFAIGSATATVSFSTSVTCVPGDIITMTAPVTQDATLAFVSFSIVALLTL